MKNRLSFILAVAIIACVVLIFIDGQYKNIWNERRVLLTSTVEAGVWMQTIVVDFRNKVGRYPTPDELAQILHYIRSYNEGVSPYKTNKIDSAFDDSGGWFYNPATGEVKINYNKRYKTGLRSWVEVSNITFSTPTHVELLSANGSNIWDCSNLDRHVLLYNSNILEIIRNWATTNSTEKMFTN